MLTIKHVVFFCLLAICTLSFCNAQVSRSLKPYLSGIFANNADTIQRWYTTHFGFKIKEERHIPADKVHFYLLEKEGFHLEIIQWAQVMNTQNIRDTLKTFKFLTGYFKTAFSVTKIKDWLRYLKSVAVHIENENVATAKNGLFILCKDPEGNLVQLFERPDQ